MEWRRYWPKKLIFFLSVLTFGSTVAFIASMFISFDAVEIAGMPFAISIGSLIAIIVNNGRYKELYLIHPMDTEEFEDLLRAASGNFGRIEDHKVRSRKVFVRFRIADMFTYYPRSGMIKIPASGFGIKEFLSSYVSTHGISTSSNVRRDLDSELIKDLILEMKRGIRREEADLLKLDFKPNTVNRNINIITLILCLIFGLIVAGILTYFIGFVFGLLIGVFSGFLFWVFLLLLALLLIVPKYGDVTFPHRYHYKNGSWYFTDKKKKRITQLPGERVREIKKFPSIKCVLITTDERGMINDLFNIDDKTIEGILSEGNSGERFLLAHAMGSQKRILVRPVKEERDIFF